MTAYVEGWFVIAAISIGTYAFRSSFLVFAHRLGRISSTTRAALRMVPSAALAALVAPALVRPAGSIDLLSPELVAGVIALIVSLRTNSILATIAAGLVGVVAIESLLST